MPELRLAVAEANRRFHGIAVDPLSEVVVTSGATEALFVSLAAVLNPGDEVVVFEPLYDTYLPVRSGCWAACRSIVAPVAARLVAAGRPRGRSAELRRALAAAFGPRTKAVLLNTPMNPTGKVFSRAELERIAESWCAHDAYAICDEVYEHLVFDGLEHVPLMTLPGMRDRTMRIGSAGKTFSLTGWKIGYLTAPAPLAHCWRRARTATWCSRARPTSSARWRWGLDAAGPRISRGSLADLAAQVPACSADGLASARPSRRFPVGGSYFLTVDIGSLGFGGDRHGVLPPHHHRGGGRRDPGLGLLRLRPAAPRWSASPSASARRCWPRRWTRLRRHLGVRAAD